jgi:hypothetical protein
MSEAQAVATPVAVVRKVLTRDEQIAQYQEKADELLAKAEKLIEEGRKEEALQSIGAGVKVSFEVGRAETRREVSGVVLAAYDVSGKRKVKALVGEGAEAELFEVEVSKLISAELPHIDLPEWLAGIN